MDRVEAIRELTQWRDQMKSHGVPNYGKKLTALDLAIEALVLRDKYVKALERIIEGAKEINRFLEEASKKSDEKLQLSGETSTCKLKKDHDFLIKPDSDECKEQKSKLDCISRQDAIEEMNEVPFVLCYDYNMEQDELVDTIEEQIRGCAQRMLKSLPPVTPTEQNEEDILKFYYVESLDEYWIGQRCGTRYYGKWTGNCFTFGYSRYLPWGEHVVAPDTLWKEHTYPSEPKEIPFNEWLQGFLEKECQTERTGEWIVYPLKDEGRVELECPECGYALIRAADRRPHFCENCGAKMGGAENE